MLIICNTNLNKIQLIQNIKLKNKKENSNF